MKLRAGRGRSRMALAGVILAAVVVLAMAGGAEASILPCGVLSPCPTPGPGPGPGPTPVPSPTPTPVPPPVVHGGAEYDARVGNFNPFVILDLSRDGRRITHYELGFRRGRCSNGATFVSYWRGAATGSTVTTSGRLAYVDKYSKAVEPTRGGVIVKGRERIGFRVRFSDDRVDGVLHDSFRSRRMNCSSGAVRFTAYRAGSPQAPLRTKLLASGRYSDLNGGYTAGLRVSAPLRIITTMRVNETFGCQNGFVFKSHSDYYYLPITRSGRFVYRVHGADPPNRRGVYDRYRETLSGAFSGPTAPAGSESYAVRGIDRTVVSYFRRGRMVGGCVADATFYATGPHG